MIFGAGAASIVFVLVADPVGPGFLASLARPGGNITGSFLLCGRHQGEMAGAAQTDRTGRNASGGPSAARVPWRFSAAGGRSAWLDHCCRRPKTCTHRTL